MKTTRQAINPRKYYLRLMYHEWFYEFDAIREIKEFCVKMDKEKPMWDYDCFCIHRGDKRWMTDKNFGCMDFKFVSSKTRKEIENYRHEKATNNTLGGL